MPRKKRQDIKLNDNSSLEGLLQEAYNDACLQIIDAQITINTLVTGTNPTDVEDATKIAKTKGDILKVKDSAIRIKLELAKLQNDIIKNGGSAESAVKERTGDKASLNDFKSIREMLNNDKDLEVE